MDTNWNLGLLQWRIEGPRTAIWLNLGVVPPSTPAVGHGLVHIDGRICFGSATPTCMGDHKSLEAGGALVEEKLKWKWLR